MFSSVSFYSNSGASSGNYSTPRASSSNNSTTGALSSKNSSPAEVGSNAQNYSPSGALSSVKNAFSALTSKVGSVFNAISSAVSPKSTKLSGSARRRKQKDNDNKSKNIKIGLLNINSIGSEVNRKKLNFIEEYLSQDKISFLALTEYINTNENNIDKYFMNGKRFPIISHPEIKRVALAIPGFLYDSFKIVDHWFLRQNRKQKDDKIAQILTLEYHEKNTKFHISVVYIAPDITSKNRSDVFTKMCDLANEYENLIALGDINFNQKISYNKAVLEEHFDNKMTQLVTQVTRHSKYTVNVKVSYRNTIVDLIFATDSIRKKIISKPKIIKRTPSDHYLVEIELGYDA